MNGRPARHLARSLRFKRSSLLSGILLTLWAWFASAQTSSAKPTAAVPGCSASYCSYLPLAALAPLLRIEPGSPLGTCKGTCYAFGGVTKLTGSQPLYDATLTARFFNDADQLIRTEVITPELHANLPGQHNRFTFFAEPSFNPTRYELALRSWSITSTIDYRPVTVVSQQGFSSEALGSVWGVIRNDYPRALTDIVVLAELHGLGSEYRTATVARLAPGATAAFSVSFEYPGAPNGQTQPVVQAVGQLEP